MTNRAAPPRLGRRHLLTGLGALSLWAAGRPAAARADHARLLLAPSTASILVARAVDQGTFGLDVELGTWRSLDELRAAIIGGRVDGFTLPTNVAANLHSRGLPVHMVNVISAGAMWVVSRNASIQALADLQGRRVQLYFKDDLPDVAFRWLLQRAGLSDGVALDHAGSAVETAQLLLAGRAETALLNEPAASAALIAAEAAGITLHRAFTLQGAWAELTGDPTPLPMAGLAVREATLALHPSFVPALHDGCVAAADWALRGPEAAAAFAAARLGFPADVTARALASAAIRVEGARAVRPQIEAFLQALAELSPALIGGRLPPDDFYVPL
ncbi:MAG: ABC transporter substrate-binding protein [Geminicoccaceae bacterium]|nr:MAG: ABC transporter substrate-binding protein [Geminicoccaceae bacterium]